MRISPGFQIIVFLSSIVLSGCEKKEKPVVETMPATNITNTSVIVGGRVTSDGGEVVASRGICWSKNINPSVNNSKTIEGSGLGEYFSSLENLDPGTVYFIKAYAKNSEGTAYGSELSFRTLGEIPSASLTESSGITDSSAHLVATINPNYVSTSVFFEFGTTPNYGSSVTASGSPVNGNNEITIFQDIYSLVPGTIYHYRVRAVNSLGTTYSEDKTFRTLGDPPMVTSLTSSNVTTSSARVSASVNANFVSTTVTVEFGTSDTYSNSVTATQNPVTGNTGVSVSADIQSLLPGTVYHYRVKAVNSLGTTYSEEKTFKTLGNTPMVTTPVSSNLTTSSVRVSANVNASYLTTAVSIEYGTSETFENSLTANLNPVTGNTNVPVSAILSSLNPGTLYYFRIKSQNALGITYSSKISVTTLGQAPAVITYPVTNSYANSTILKGSVNANYLTTNVIIEYGTTLSLGSAKPVTPNTVTGQYPVIVKTVLSDLVEGASYYYRIRAENSLGITMGEILTFVAAPPLVDLTDVEGNIYPVVQIGSQYWMAENLKTTKYNDNTDIPLITDGSEWAALNSPGYCWYENNSVENKDIYGALYNFYAVKTGKLCPTGWHVPTNDDFTALTSFLGDINTAGGKLKEAGTAHWLSPNTGATNETGFTALPAGKRNAETGAFEGIGKYEVWWSSTPYNEIKPWYRSVGFETSMLFVGNGTLNQHGSSIRCIMD